MRQKSNIVSTEISAREQPKFEVLDNYFQVAYVIVQVDLWYTSDATSIKMSVVHIARVRP